MALYEAFYGLARAPFSLNPDPTFLFPSRHHREALAGLYYAISDAKGFAVLTGEVGTGKTTIVHALLDQLGTTARSALVFNPGFGQHDLYLHLLAEFRLPPEPSVMACIRSLQRFLIEQFEAEVPVVVVIDEAHALSATLLEEVRLLSNFETSRRKLLQVLLVGQPELLERLRLPELRQLRQRVALRFDLPPLSFAETVEYVARAPGGRRRRAEPVQARRPGGAAALQRRIPPPHQHPVRQRPAHRVQPRARRDRPPADRAGGARPGSRPAGAGRIVGAAQAALPPPCAARAAQCLSLPRPVRAPARPGGGMIPRHYSPRSLALVGIELTWIVLTLAAALAVDMLRRHGVIWTDQFVPQLLFATALYATVLYYADLYNFSSLYVRRDLFAAAVRGFSGLAVVFGLIFFLWTDLLDFEPDTILVHLLLTAGFVLVFRRRIDHTLTRAGISTRLAIVGTGAEAQGLAREILRLGEYAHDVTCFVGEGSEPIRIGTPNPGVHDIPLVPAAELVDFARARRIKRILVATADLGRALPLQDLLRCKAAGFDVEDGHTFYERLLGRILTADLQPEWLIFSDGFTRSAGAGLVKRGVDLVASTCLLVLTAPLCLLVAALIKLEDGGPVLFRQTRAGRDGAPFLLYKFRSMSVDAEAASGPKWAETDDPRVTRIGRWIRKLRIDEIPQAWNVLLGDMSFVGPRPERPEFVRQLAAAIPYYDYRHGMRPGITGWAQVNYPYGATVEESRVKLEFDLYYLKNFSLLMDLYIMVRTVKILLFGWGSR